MIKMKKVQLNRFTDDGRWKIVEFRHEDGAVWLEAREGKKGDKNYMRILIKLNDSEIAHVSKWLEQVFIELQKEEKGKPELPQSKKNAIIEKS